MFPCFLSQEFPRSLHFYITNTREKSEDRKHNSRNSNHLQTWYFISRQWLRLRLNSLFRCLKNPSRGVPASLLTHAWLLWRSSSPHSDPACRRGTSHPRKTFWRWCWWLPSWWVWTWCRVGRHASWGWWWWSAGTVLPMYSILRVEWTWKALSRWEWFWVDENVVVLTKTKEKCRLSR